MFDHLVPMTALFLSLLSATLSMPPGLHKLPIAPKGTLRSISRSNSTWSGNEGHWPIPAARSYDAMPWETAQDLTSTGVGLRLVNCSTSHCFLHIPDEKDADYRLTEYNLSAWRQPNKARDAHLAAARTLAQGTFGPQRAAIDSLSESGFNTPDTGNTVRIVNLAPVEFPCYIHLNEIA